MDQIKGHLKAFAFERNPYTSPQNLKTASDYLADQFSKYGLRVREETVPFEGSIKATTTLDDAQIFTNILGAKLSESAQAEAFVLGAHYDTVERSPGADDNASAVAALLCIAEALKSVELKADLILAAFTLEEYGYVGSRFFLEQALERGNLFSGMISLEMLGYRDFTPGSQSYPPYVDAGARPNTGDFIAVVANEPSAPLANQVVHGLKLGTPDLPVETLVVPGDGSQFPEVQLSDHSPFWDRQIPAVMVTDTAFFRNPNYHKPEDTLDTLDLNFIEEVANGVAAFIEHRLG